MMADETLSMSEPPYSSGTSTEVRPRSLAFFNSSRQSAKSFCFELAGHGHDFVVRELFGGLGDEPVLVVKVFRREDLVGRGSEIRKIPPEVLCWSVENVVAMRFPSV